MSDKHKKAIEAIRCNYPPERYTMLREALDISIKLLEREGCGLFIGNAGCCRGVDCEGFKCEYFRDTE